MEKNAEAFQQMAPAVLPVGILDSGTRYLSKKFTNIYPPSFLGNRAMN
jgi:hypothetical protein